MLGFIVDEIRPSDDAPVVASFASTLEDDLVVVDTDIKAIEDLPAAMISQSDEVKITNLKEKRDKKVDNLNKIFIANKCLRNVELI